MCETQKNRPASSTAKSPARRPPPDPRGSGPRRGASAFPFYRGPPMATSQSQYPREFASRVIEGPQPTSDWERAGQSAFPGHFRPGDSCTQGFFYPWESVRQTDDSMGNARTRSPWPSCKRERRRNGRESVARSSASWRPWTRHGQWPHTFRMCDVQCEVLDIFQKGGVS